MAVLVLFAQSFGRQYDVIRGLFLAGFVMILINPFLLLYDIGFQLSFMATLGLILIAPYFETILITKRKIQVKEFLFATLSTQIAVLPLLLYHIGEVSLVAVIVNVLVLPIVPVAMLLTFITGIVGLVSIPLASLLGYFTTLSLKYILVIAERFSDLPFASVTVPVFSPVGVLLSYLSMILVFWFISHRKKTVHGTLHGWTIETESEKPPPSSNKSSKTKEVDEAELPIFFR